MRKRPTSKLKPIQEVNVAPLIDIIFILVIFFMVSSTLIVHSGMKVKLPSAKNTGSVKQEKLIVYIDDKNNVYLNKIKVSKKELSSKIMENLKKGGKPFVTVKADKKVQYENIINIIDICKDSGIKDISFATNKQKNVNYE